MICLGIDLHSDCFTCCFIYEDGRKHKVRFQLGDESLLEFFKLLTLNTYVMVEASTNTFKFVELIKEKVKEVYVANTHKLKLISLVKKKTDKIDAEKLAIFLKMQITSNEELIKPVYLPEETIQDLRSLFTTYSLIKKQINQIKNRIHAIYKQNLHPFTREYIFSNSARKEIKKIQMGEVADFHINYLFEVLENLEKKFTEIEEAIKVIGKKYYKEIEILTSMKGISVLTAIAIMADVGEIKRFPNSKHFTSYLRSAPGVDSSNEETRITKTTKFGRKLSVSLLSQSLNHFRDNDLRLMKWYNKKVEVEFHKRGKIRMGLCRKVFAEIYQMLKKREYHYYRKIKNHLKKMNEYDLFLERNILFKKIA
jgi:transposase